MPPSPPPEAPWLWIIAGANGSGKTTAYAQATVDAPAGSIWIINPDLLAKRLSEQESLALNPDANLEAVRRIEAWLYASLAAHQTVGVETVLSTDKYRRLVETAHAHGFRVRLIYVFLETPELNIERVRARVASGGHDVPEDKIRSRRTNSLHQLGWFFDAADWADIYDNSLTEPRLVVRKVRDEIEVYADPPGDLLEAIEPVIPGLTETLKREREDG